MKHDADGDHGDDNPDGPAFLAGLAALASAPRLRIVAALVGGRNYVSQLAREVGLSRPLLQMHLKRLEEAGIVTSRLELSADGKAMRFYEVRPFALSVTPATVAAAAATLPVEADPDRD